MPTYIVISIIICAVLAGWLLYRRAKIKQELDDQFWYERLRGWEDD